LFLAPCSSVLLPRFAFFYEGIIEEAFHAAVIAAGALLFERNFGAIEMEIDDAGIAFAKVLAGLGIFHYQFAF
jgi:hypothetical protein